MYSMVSYQPATNRIQSLHLTISSMGSKWLHWVWLMTTKTATTATTFVLMPLSRLARVGNFWFNLLFPFLLIVPVLCFNAISFRILLYALFRQFPWSNLFFTSYFKIFNLTNLKFDVSTDDMTITLQTAFNYHIFRLQNSTHSVLKNISQQPINQSSHTHPDQMMFNPTHPQLFCNSKILSYNSTTKLV